MKSLITFTAIAVLAISGLQKQAEHRVERLEVDGVPLIRTSGGPKYTQPLIETESELIIGIDEGEPEWQMFTANTTLLVTSNGKMIIADRKRFEIYVVSRDGLLEARLGGEGSGPGEFRDMLDIFWAEFDREFWVSDQINSRITRFSTDGDLLGSFNYGGIRSEYSRFYGLGERRFLGEGIDVSNAPPYTNLPKKYAFLNDKFEITSEFISLQNETSFRLDERQSMPLPFASSDRIMIIPDGRILLVHAADPRLTIFSTTGEPELHIERDWEKVPVTRAEKNEIQQGFRERGIIDQNLRIPFPDYKPLFGSVIPDSEGRIWIRKYTAPGERVEVDETGYRMRYPEREYEIIGTDGIWLGIHSQRHSPRLITAEHMYVAYSSEAGAPRFERLRIIPLVPEMEPGK